MEKNLTSKTNYSKWTLIGLALAILACPIIYTTIFSLNVGSSSQINKIDNNFAYITSFIMNIIVVILLFAGINDINKNKKGGLLFTGIGILLVIINFFMIVTMSIWNSIG